MVPFQLNQRVMDRNCNRGTVTFVHLNRAMGEYSYTIQWDSGMTGSFTQKQIEANSIQTWDYMKELMFQPNEVLAV